MVNRSKRVNFGAPQGRLRFEPEGFTGGSRGSSAAIPPVRGPGESYAPDKGARDIVPGFWHSSGVRRELGGELYGGLRYATRG